MNMAKFDAPFIDSGIVIYSQSEKVSSAPNPFVVQVQMPESTLLDVFFNLAQAREGTIGRQSRSCKRSFKWHSLAFQ